ncbi:M24 family metallopeptidase [Salinicoccus sp. HZC-1]|uniref:M24 family metallopeptidase n=1 Tax=Salinicoccus sp. HZC-1 TaxID=3385497 RepID=UPI00398A8584
MTQIYEQRMQTLRTQLTTSSIDTALIVDPTNIYYLTGFYAEPHERFMALVLDVKDHNTLLFIPALDETAAKASAHVGTIHPISDEDDPFDILNDNLPQGIGMMGIEMDHLSVARYHNLRRIMPTTQYEDVRPLIDQQRIIKTSDEIDQLKDAVNIIEQVLEEGTAGIHQGMTESGLVAELEYLMKKHGALGPSFSTMVLSGAKSALPHGIPGDKVLREEDFLLIDFGVITKERYCSDITRTFIIGRASEKQKEIYDIVKASTRAGVDAVEAGAPLKNFDIAARKVIEDHGYGQYFNNRIGHGLGMEVHEAPSIHMENEAIAQKGMVFTIEPGIYIPGYGGVRIEEEVHIDENGKVELLTSFPRDLKVLELK